ncbi:pentapeptide repeat-containing protein [Rhodococcoides corynebacterioides]|uniref:pentapeptide repeat-containing protein n=1 Tax=Rhodococcoides corynebacterioides TaxID=53972 RepID=UPI003AEA06B5
MPPLPQAPAQPRRRRVPEWVWRDGFVALLVAAVVSAATISVQYQLDENRAGRELRAANLSFVRDKASSNPDVPKPFNFLDLSHQNLIGLALVGADFTGANLTGSLLDNSDLNAAKFENATAVGARFLDTKLGTASLSFGRFDRAQFFYTIMPSDLTYAQFDGAIFQFATVPRDADFRGSDLQGANLAGLNLSSAVFGDDGSTGNLGSDLHGANLVAADLSNALFSGAPRSEAERTSNNLYRGDDPIVTPIPAVDAAAKIVDICYDNFTKWPAGFTPPPNSPDTCKKFSDFFN